MRLTTAGIFATAAFLGATALAQAENAHSTGLTSIQSINLPQSNNSSIGATDLGRTFRYAGPVVGEVPVRDAGHTTRLEWSPGADAPPAPPMSAVGSTVKTVKTPLTQRSVAGPITQSAAESSATARPENSALPRVYTGAYRGRGPATPVHFDPNMLVGGATASSIVSTASDNVYDNATAEGKYWTDSCGCESGCADCCCGPCWHRSGAFFDFLYLHASGVDVSYALPQDGINTGSPATGTAPMGTVGVADPDYEGGARAGFTYALDCCSSLTATYTWYESDTNHGIAVASPLVIRSLLHPPAVVTSLEGFGNSAVARYDIDFDLFDLDYRRLYSGGKCHAVNYLIGVRYAYLNQELTMDVASTTTSRVATDVDFEGLGFRFGVDGERHAACSGLFVYGRAIANILAGEVRADYLLQNTAPATLVNVRWEDDRVVPILEYELGAGWQNQCGTLRFSAGYYMAAWFNTVSTGTWVQAVQNTNFVNVDDTMTFDGLTARVEVRW